MNKEDLLESFKPHTTSKVYEAHELHSISTLGFRGEALSSIASVSDLEIQSKPKGGISGYALTIMQGIIANQKSVGIDEGTTISISNIFVHLPARKKFLKSEKTEFRVLLEIVSNFVLSYPEIEFTLIHNSKEYFKFTKQHDLSKRIQTLLGDSLFVNLIPISYEESYIKIEGYISKPQYAVKGQSKLFTFINRRKIGSPLLGSAIKVAYKNLLEYASYPIALLFITIPYEMVDVNIHPRKEQVSFIDQDFIYSTIEKAVAEVLQNNNITFLNVSWKDGGTKTHLGKLLKYQLQKELGKPNISSTITQMHNVYLITETDTGMMILDQHAAHEAILFRTLKSLYEKQKSKHERYQLPTPYLLDLALSDNELLSEYKDLFNSLGFEIEEFGNTFRINTVPMIFKDRDFRDLITETLEDIREGKKVKDIDRRTYRMLSYLACRGAIKAGEKLDTITMKKLISDLQRDDMTYTCPHGRPVKIEFSLSYLDHLFKRS